MKIYEPQNKKKGSATSNRSRPMIWTRTRQLTHAGWRKKIGKLATVGTENPRFSLLHCATPTRPMKGATQSVSFHRLVVAFLVLLKEVESFRHLRLREIALLEHRCHLNLRFFARGKRGNRVAPIGRELDVRIPPHVNERTTWSFAVHTGLLTISQHVLNYQMSTRMSTKTETNKSFCLKFILKNFSFLLLTESGISFCPENSLRFGRRRRRRRLAKFDMSDLVQDN